MRRTLILHIGTNKTGSTTLQRVLLENRQSLLAQGVYYPETPRGTSHLLLCMAFTSFKTIWTQTEKKAWRGIDPIKYLDSYRESFRAEIAALPPEIATVIISSENFAQSVKDAEDIAALRAYLDPMFDRFKVVVYLRRQDGHFASSYTQQLRMGRIAAPGLRRPDPFSQAYDYYELLTRWAAAFGEASIQPRIFERDTDASFDVVADFGRTFGIDLSSQASAGARQANQSVTASGQRILADIGRILESETGRSFAGSLLWERLTAAVSATLPGAGWRPTRDEAEAFVARFESSNEAVRRHWFPQKSTLFSTDYSKLPAVPESVDGAAEYGNALAVLVRFAKGSIERERDQAKKRADMAVKAGEPMKGVAALLKAVRLDKNDTASRLRLAARQIAEGSYVAARHHIDFVLDLSPEHPVGLRLADRLKRVERRSTLRARRDAGVPPADAPVAADAEDVATDIG
jgi:hypothetical protein